jgi:hypothetical protein
MFSLIGLKTHNTSSTNKLTINCMRISNKTPRLIIDCFATSQYVFSEAQPRQTLPSFLPSCLLEKETFFSTEIFGSCPLYLQLF